MARSVCANSLFLIIVASVTSMFRPLLRIQLSIFRSNHTSKVKNALDMNTAYFRHVEGDENVHVTFRYVNQEIGIDKQFNFCRRISESCAAFLSRVRVNVEKAVYKRLKATGGTMSVHNARLLCDNSPIAVDIIWKEIIQRTSPLILKIGNMHLPVKINEPWVETIALPKSIMAGFLTYPSKFESFFTDKDVSFFSWYRGDSNSGPWEECGSGEFYTTQPADVGKFLRIVCRPSNNAGKVGPHVEAVSAKPLEAGPGVLPCEQRHTFTQHKLNDDGIRIISYNILADLYVDQEYSRTILFGYCAPYALDLSYRKQLLVKELLGYNADLICLQEVDSKVFRYDLEPLLARRGMSGKFSKKGGGCNEGTAVFFDQRKFKCLDSRQVLLSEVLQNDARFQDVWNKVRKNEALAVRITERANTAQLLLLENHVKPNHLLVVVNIHLYFHPDADHIRLLQAVITTMYVESMMAEVKSNYPDKEVALVWCGDFNSTPECGIYQLLTTGHVSEDNTDWQSNATEAVTEISHSHPLKLDSACGTPQYTNYTVGFKACIDYIFYDTERLQVQQVVPFPSEEDLSEHLGIPSILYPSDHVALVADLKW